MNGTGADWIAECAADPKEVRAFCVRHGLLRAADLTLRLAREIYQPRAIRAGVEADPEGSSEWLVFDVEVRKTVDELLDAQDEFAKRWIALLPGSKLLLIRVPTRIV